MSTGPYLECGHGQCDTRMDCLICLQFTIQVLNDILSKKSIELSDCQADLIDAQELYNYVCDNCKSRLAKKMIFQEADRGQPI